MSTTPRYVVRTLPVPENARATTIWGSWLRDEKPLDAPQGPEATHSWFAVLWLTGVDYFSTLGYQPGIALLAAGALSPIATGILIAATLLGALPVYIQVASRSFAGQGSIAMLESLLPSWRGKALVLILIGFAATDFVITMTLSAADAAEHAVENPLLHPYLGEHRVALTILLLAMLAVVFLMGFREAIGLAMLVAIPYLFLNTIVIGRSFIEVFNRPELLRNWTNGLSLHGDWTMIVIASALIFPKLALGLSGFETGVTVMPLIKGERGESSGQDGSVQPRVRIRDTRKLLAVAAVIMSLMLLSSSFVTALLIPPRDYAPEGAAAGRALSYLAHGFLGSTFGTVYDLSTILILWFAGASAMTGLMSLVPRYLPRFGMAPRWAAYGRPLVLLLFAVNVAVTVIFDADVEAQAGAYATGVLALMLSAAVAVSIALWRESAGKPEAPGRMSGSPRFVETGSPMKEKQLGAVTTTTGPQARPGLRWLSFYFWIISAVFAFTLIENVLQRPDGVIIALFFIAAIIILGAVSRFWRSTELRVSKFDFVDDESVELWQSMVGKKVNLVPLRTSSEFARDRKVVEICRYYRISGPMAFIHVNLIDNRSEFISPLQVLVRKINQNYVIEVSGAIAIANTIAYLSELLDPVSVFLGLTRENLMLQAFKYLFWGEGESGLMVYSILLRYWEWTPEKDIRPLIFLVSE